MFKQYRVAVSFALLALLVGLGSYFIFNGEKKDNVITLTKKGFAPDYLEITIGETVTFKNKTDKLFWPAADIHPYHTDYPDFDPKRALSQEEKWELKFDRIGKWTFHDHISPNFTGTIIVTEVNGEPTNGCIDINKRECWTNILSTTWSIVG